MAKSEIFVIAYRLEAYNNYDALDGFMEAICDYAAYKYFGKEGYTISTLGLLGPFKKFN